MLIDLIFFESCLCKRETGEEGRISCYDDYCEGVETHCTQFSCLFLQTTQHRREYEKNASKNAGLFFVQNTRYTLSSSCLFTLRWMNREYTWIKAKTRTSVENLKTRIEQKQSFFVFLACWFEFWNREWMEEILGWLFASYFFRCSINIFSSAPEL